MELTIFMGTFFGIIGLFLGLFHGSWKDRFDRPYKISLTILGLLSLIVSAFAVYIS